MAGTPWRRCLQSEMVTNGTVLAKADETYARLLSFEPFRSGRGLGMPIKPLEASTAAGPSDADP